jgi:CheY-like chemotaxis protein
MTESKKLFCNSQGLLFTFVLIDDNELDIETMKRLFKKKNIQSPLRAAVNGHEGFEILKQLEMEGGLESNPIAIFLDINMPQMNGYEFLKMLNMYPRLKDIPVFMLTTSKSNFDLTKAERAGSMAFFNKFDVTETEDGFVEDVSICCRSL